MKKTAPLLTIALIVIPFMMIFDPAASTTQNDSWEPGAQMLTAACRLGVAVCNEKIYAIGGYDENWKLTGTNQMYDPSSDSWTIQASMPTPRACFGIAVCQNKIYAIGGANKSGLVPFSNFLEVTGVTDINEVYDPSTNTWQTMAPMPTTRSQMQANVVDNKIYVVGGFNLYSNFEFVNYTDVYDPLTDSWSRMSPAPIHQEKFSSAVCNDKIYFINDEITQIFDPKTDTWTSASPPPHSIFIGAAGARAGTPMEVYVFGGGANGDLTQIYAPAGNTWTQGALMPTPRTNLAVAVFADAFFVIGGTEPINGTILAVNEKYIPADYGVASDDQETLTESASSDQTQTIHTTLLVATAVSVTLVAIGLAAYFRKSKHT